MQSTKTPGRKRMNFMIDVRLVEELKRLVASGEKSNFVNQVLEEGLIQFSREKAAEESDRLRERFSTNLSDEEIKKEMRYGLE